VEEKEMRFVRLRRAEAWRGISTSLTTPDRQNSSDNPIREKWRRFTVDLLRDRMTDALRGKVARAHK
jgi:hypothetical protein